MCCPKGFSEEFISFFLLKMSQINTKNDKKRKFLNFQCFYAFFVEVSTDSVDWKVLRVQQRGTGWLSSILFRRVYCISLIENVSN